MNVTVVDTYTQLPIGLIRIDGGTQSRSTLVHEKINEYAQLMREGTVFPPVIVYYDGSDYWLADGFHRYHAAHQIDIENTAPDDVIQDRGIQVEIKQGSRRDAQLYSMGANTRHGIPLSLDDRKRCAQAMLEDEEWSQWSDREIGRRCGLSPTTVGAIRKTVQNGQNPTNQPVEPVEEVEKPRLNRTNEEKRNDVLNFLATTPKEELDELSNVEIAEKCGVTEFLVRTIKKELQAAQERAEQEAARYASVSEVEEPEPEPTPEPEPEPETHDVAIQDCFGDDLSDEEDEKFVLDNKQVFDAIDAGIDEVEDVTEPVSEPAQPIEEHTVVTPEPEPVEDTATPEIESISSEQEAPAPAPAVEEEDNHVQSQGLAPALTSSESNEWYTPYPYVNAARKLLGGIDVDPASNATANKVIDALTYYDIESNGLDKPWYGRVWLNPPYGRDNGGSNQEVWSHRLLEQYKAGITKEAVLLVNANTEAKWFQPLYEYLICFTNHRIRFYNTEGTPNQPTQGNALIYLGHQQERFIEIFKQFGRIVKAVD